MADGLPPFPGQGVDQSKSRTGLGGAELQSQAGHQYPGGSGAAAGAPSSPRLIRTFPITAAVIFNCQRREFSHGLESGHPDRATMLGILGPRFRGDERKPIQSDRNL